MPFLRRRLHRSTLGAGGLLLVGCLSATAFPRTVGAQASGHHDRAAAVSRPTTDQPLEIELRSAARTLVPGAATDLAIRVSPQPGWHTYWRYSGDVGGGLAVEWQLPQGFTAVPLRWPTPTLMRSGPLASYGYEHEMQVLGGVRVPADAPVGSRATIAGTISWVACRVECIAGEARVSLNLPVAAAAVPDTTVVRAIAESAELVPMPGSDWQFVAAVEPETIVLRVRPPGAADLVPSVDLAKVQFFVDSSEVIDHAAPVSARVVGDELELRIVRSEYSRGAPSRVTGLLTLAAAGSADERLAVEVTAPVVPSEQLAAGVATSGGALALLVAGLLALLGGTLLNLMPCVLPVLSIKAMGVAEAAGQDGRSALRHTLLFGAGVMVSMWALVATLLAMRAAGAEVGWGFQLQSPAVVAALALIVFAAALNMAGLFELGPVGGGLAVAAGRTPPATEAFLSGVLITALATPCSAPFLATAVAFGIAGGALSAFVVFTALGLGLVWPLALVAAVPRVRRWLPKPGLWMVTLRQVLAFPLLATVVWLAWVIGRQAGTGAVTALLAALTVLAFGLWALGRFGTIVASTATRRSAQAVALVSAAAALAIVIAGSRLAAPLAAAERGGAASARTADGLEWRPYSGEALNALRDSGRVVLVDFTADWCLTCKLNERVALAADTVRAMLRAHDVVLLRADWTTRDPVVTRALAAFGRNSVPFVVLYHRDRQASPTILPTLLTPGIVTRALDEAVRASPTAD